MDIQNSQAAQEPNQIDVIKTIEELLNCAENLHKSQINVLPDLSKCDFIEFYLNNYSNNINKLGIFFYQNDIFIGVLNNLNSAIILYTTKAKLCQQ